jgi:Cu-processing system permease protein
VACNKATAWASLVLGAVFLGVGYLISALSRRPSGAAGMAIAVWLVLIVLYDLALLALVVADKGGALIGRVLAPALVASPADAFRLYNLAVSEATAAAAGLAGAAATIPPAWPLASLLIWPFAALGLAVLAFERVRP